MKIVIANTDLMVSKLIEACAKKTGLQVQHFISLEEVDSSMLEDCFLFVDENALGSDTKRAKQIGTESLSCLIYSRRKPLNEFKYLVQKPFLPTQILELLRKELVNRGEDFNRAVEEEQKTPIEPIKDIPLNEFDLKDEHLFEGNLELPPLPDTDAVETKTSAQSAKEQKEQVDEEENFLEVGENIEHKSLAALEREKSGASIDSVDDLGGDLSNNAGQAISNEPDFLSEPVPVDALGGEFAGQSSPDANEPDSALDIRESLAGDLDSIDENSLDSSLGGSLDSPLDGQLDSLDKLDDLGSASVLGNLDGLGSADSALSADSSVASSAGSERDELLGDDISGGDGLSGDLGVDLDAGLGEVASEDLLEGVDLGEKQDDLGDLDSLGDSLEDLDTSSEAISNEATEDIAGVADSANGVGDDLLQEVQESSPDFAAQGGVLDKDEAQEIQDLLAENAGAQGVEVADSENSSNSADETAGLSADIEGANSVENVEINAGSDFSSEVLTDISDESANTKSKESQEFIQESIGEGLDNVVATETAEASEPSTQESQVSSQESTQEKPMQENAKEASEDFADLSEGDIMEVLGEEDLSSDVASGDTSLDKETSVASGEEPLSDESVAEIQSVQDSSQESAVESPQESITGNTSIEDSIVEEASVAEVAKEQASDEADSLPQEASADKEIATDSIHEEVIKDLQESLEQDLQKGLEDEMPTVLQNDLAEGEPPSKSNDEISKDTTKDEASNIDEALELADLSEQVESQADELSAKDSSDSKEDLASGMEQMSALENDLQDLAQDDLSKDLAASGLEESVLQADSLDNAEAGGLDDIDLDKSSDLEAGGLEDSSLDSGSLDEGDMPKTELPKSLEELENLIESKDSISGLDTAIAELDTSLEKGVAQDFDIKDSSFDSSVESSVESGLKDSAKSSNAKSTQRRLITELLANKSAEEISSLLEGAHIRIDIDFSQD